MMITTFTIRYNNINNENLKYEFQNYPYELPGERKQKEDIRIVGGLGYTIVFYNSKLNIKNVYEKVKQYFYNEINSARKDLDLAEKQINSFFNNIKNGDIRNKELKMENKKEFVAYDAANNDYERFETFEEAEKWLQDGYKEQISEETIEGKDFIAEITHRSKFNETDKKSYYHEHTDECPEDCDEEEWPYDNEWEFVGNVELDRIK